MEISEVTDEAGLTALAAEWEELLAAAENMTPFQTWQWQAPWWRNLGRGRLWVLLAREGGRLVGLMPLFVASYYGLPVRRVCFVGTRLSDYQDLIARAGREEECRDAFLAHLHSHRRRWDLIDLHDVRAGTALARLPRRRLQALHHHRICPVAELAPTWEAYAAKLGKNLRANIGRRRRQLEKQLQAKCETVKEPAELAAALDDLFRLHGQRWRRRGVSGSFVDAAVQRFHSEAAAGFLAQGLLRLHRLRSPDRTLATSYCFQLGPCVTYYQGGFDPEYSRFSVGLVLMAYAIAEAIAGGARVFDFARGSESYKYEWLGGDRETLRLVIGRPWSLRSWLGLLVNAVERRVEQIGLGLQRRKWGRKERRPAGPDRAN